MPIGRRTLALPLLGLMACASNPAPSGTLPTAEALGASPYGGYILVVRGDGSETEGELLAAHDGLVHVRGERGWHVIRQDEIRSMRLAVYQTGQTGLTIWGLLGTLSTLSHGFVLIFSAPVWLIGTGVSAGLESRAALLDYPDQPLPAFAKYARYPQGMPDWTKPPTPAVVPTAAP